MFNLFPITANIGDYIFTPYANIGDYIFTPYANVNHLSFLSYTKYFFTSSSKILVLSGPSLVSNVISKLSPGNMLFF